MKDEYKKKLFAKWNRLTRDISLMVMTLDKEDARLILEEMMNVMLSYPKMEKFLIEYDEYVTNLEKASKNKKKTVDKKQKEVKDNVVNILDFKKSKK